MKKHIILTNIDNYVKIADMNSTVKLLLFLIIGIVVVGGASFELIHMQTSSVNNQQVNTQYQQSPIPIQTPDSTPSPSPVESIGSDISAKTVDSSASTKEQVMQQNLNSLDSGDLN